LVNALNKRIKPQANIIQNPFAGLTAMNNNKAGEATKLPSMKSNGVKKVAA